MSVETEIAPPRRIKTVLVFLCKVAIALLLVGWLWENGRLDFSQFSHIEMGSSLAGLLVFQCAMSGCIALRWHYLTRACGLNFSLRQSLRISLIGFCAAVWTPAGLGLDGVRVWGGRRLAPQQLPIVVASTFWDRALGVWSILVLTAISCGVVLIVPQAAIDVGSHRALWAALILCGVVAFLPWGAKRLLWDYLSQRYPEAASSTMFRSTSWKRAVLLAFAAHGCNALALLCALRTLDQHASVSMWNALLVTPPIILSSMVPLTPLGLGISDATASILLHWTGSSSGAEATMLGRMTFLVISALCGLAWLMRDAPNLPTDTS